MDGIGSFFTLIRQELAPLCLAGGVVMVTLVVPAPITAAVECMLRVNVEMGAVLGARIVQTEGGDLRLLVTRIWEVPQDAYVLQKSDELIVASHGFVPPLAEIEAAGGMAIWLHTHPGDGASPRPSDRDFEVDRRLSDVFRLRTDAPFYGALIVSRDGGRRPVYGARR